MDKKTLINLGRLQFPKNDRIDKNFIEQPKINLSFKSTPDSLKQHFKAFWRKPSLGASEQFSPCSDYSMLANQFLVHVIYSQSCFIP